MAIIYHVESPREDCPVFYGTITVEGWAFSAEGKSLDIRVKLGRQVMDPRQRIRREDVREAYPNQREYAYESGFTCLLEPTEKEKHKSRILRIEAREGKKGRWQTLGAYLLDGDGRFGHLYLRTQMYLQRNGVPKTVEEWHSCLQKFRAGLVRNRGKAIGVEDYVSPGSFTHQGLIPGNERYERWRENNARFLKGETMQSADRLSASGTGHQPETDQRPLFSILMPVCDPKKEHLQEALESVHCQTCGDWELCVVDDASQTPQIPALLLHEAGTNPRIVCSRNRERCGIAQTTNRAAQSARGEFLVFLDHDDLLEPVALELLRRAVTANPQAEILYTDDDKMDEQGRFYDPQFKPDYAPHLLLSVMYFSHMFVIRRSLFEQVGGLRRGFEGAQDFDLALRAVEKTAPEKILHIPTVLYHWRCCQGSLASSAGAKPYSIAAGQRAVEEALRRRGIPAHAVQSEFARARGLGIYELKPFDVLGENGPLVSIIIPTRNRKGLLERCLKSVLEKTSYRNYEVLIVDDGSDEKETLDYLESFESEMQPGAERFAKCRVLHAQTIEEEDTGVHKYISGYFNFSYLVNLGVRQARGEYVLLLNNDTRVLAEDWISSMLVYAMMDDVGAVGARLEYPDGTLQHGGVVLGMENGFAGHAFKGIGPENGGYLSYAYTARDYSAVTAACLLVSKEKWDWVLGFDEFDLEESYNDVDFCLKLVDNGWRSVYCPRARLIHEEGSSRGTEQNGHWDDPWQEDAFFGRYKDRIDCDPCYNPNLSLEDTRFFVDPLRVGVGCLEGLKHGETWRDQGHSPMKILLVAHNLREEGAPLVQLQVVRQLRKQLCREGEEAKHHPLYRFVMLSSEGGELEKEYERLGIPVVLWQAEHFMSGHSPGQTMEELRKLASAQWFDLLAGTNLIYANTSSCFWGIMLAQILELPSVWGIHESLDYRPGAKAYLGDGWDWQYRACFAAATQVVFVANATKNLYASLDRGNFTVIHNGVPYEEEEMEAETEDEREGPFRILTVGTICERKGQLVLCKALDRLRSRMKEKGTWQEGMIRVTLVGARANLYQSRVRELIREKHLENFVELVPYVPHERMVAYYRESDLLVCPSFEESSPLVILEAIEADLPVVATHVYGIPELIRPEREGLLVPAGDDEALSYAMERLMEKPELGQTLACNARIRAAIFFSPEESARRYDELFQMCIARGYICPA